MGRIVSLLPSATEIVCALGARAMLVGRSHECDHPLGVDHVPVMTRPRFALGSSSAIDTLARRALADATSIYEVDAVKLESARPDVILTQDLVGLAPRDARVLNMGPLRLADVWCDVKRVADAIGRHEAGAHVTARLEARVADIAAVARSTGSRPKVLALQWIDPLMLAGMWMPELVELAGGVPLGVSADEKTRQLDTRALSAMDPDVVFVAVCGFDVKRTLEEADLLRSRLPGHWRAVRERRVWVADGNAFFNRPGPRLVESLEILASAIHPRAFGGSKAHALIDRRPTSGAGAPAVAARSPRSS